MAGVIIVYSMQGHIVSCFMAGVMAVYGIYQGPNAKLQKSQIIREVMVSVLTGLSITHF